MVFMVKNGRHDFYFFVHACPVPLASRPRSDMCCYVRDVLAEPLGRLEVKHQPPRVSREPFDDVFSTVTVTSENLYGLMRNFDGSLGSKEFGFESIKNGNFRRGVRIGGTASQEGFCRCDCDNYIRDEELDALMRSYRLPRDSPLPGVLD